MSVDTPTFNPEELHRHRAFLQRLAARLVDSRATADDLVQDTFVAALKSPPDPDRSPRPWLAQVLRNLVRNRARQAGRWATRKQKAAETGAELPTAEDLLTRHEAQRLVAELVSQLAEPYRSTVLLCYAEGLAPAEVAAKQQIPPGTVRWRLKHGLDDLRAALDARYKNDRRAWCAALAPLAAGSVSTLPMGAGLKLGAGLAAAAAAVWLAVAFGSGSGGPVGPADDSDEVASRGRASGSIPALLAPPGNPPPAGGGPDPARAGQPAAAAAQAGPSRSGTAEQGPPEAVIDRIMEVGGAPVKGNPQAPVTVVAFSEFQCPFCARVRPTLDALLEAYPKDVRLVWKNLPLKFHEHAKLAAEAALAAHEQGKFWPMYERLFENQSALDPPALEQHAEAVGLDVERFRQALHDKRHLATVEADMQLAEEAGIRGTPSFYINRVPLTGAQPLEAFEDAVQDALARAKGLPVPERPTGPQPPSPVALAKAAEPGSAPSRGPADAAVTIVLWNDFECPFCKNAHGTMNALLEAYPKDVRLVMKNLPLPFHQNATLAAEAALAAHEQGKFWPMHDRLFEKQDRLDLESLVGHARALGLDAERFRKALEEHRFLKAVQAERRAADAAGLRGTPSALVNGKPVVGNRPLEFWRTAVEQALARARGQTVTNDVLAEAGRPKRPGPDRRRDVVPGLWPPPRVDLPDALLGERLRVPFPTGDAPFSGPARAPVEVLYFNDYSCRGCGQGKVFVDGLRATYGKHLRIVARPIPASRKPPAGHDPHLVAQAAWAAHEQGKFWPMHDKFFSREATLDRAALETFAQEIGLDMSAFRAALDEGRYRKKVDEDMALLDSAGLGARPLFVINGRRADGPAALIPLVEGALKKAGIKPPRPPAPRPGLPTARPGGFIAGGAMLSIPQQFHVERRNESWAPAAEKSLVALVAPDLRALDPGAKRIQAECRSRLCRLRFHSAKSSAALAAFVKQVYGAELAANPGGSERMAYLRVGSGPEATAETDVARLRSRRAAILFSLRTGREEPDPDLPLAKLPKDSAR